MADHALATVTNPSSALTDFTLLVDLSDMPANWWSAVDTSDGTRGRVYKGDGSTRLACDWIDFDDTAETGLLRVKWTGTLATSGTQQLWIEPPVTTNATVAVDDTYGSDNAYDDDWGGYWPNGGGDDRTANGNDGSAQGSVTVGGAAGQIGNATDFDGTDDHVNVGNDASIRPLGTEEMTVMGWVNPDAYVAGAVAYQSSFEACILLCNYTSPTVRMYARTASSGWQNTSVVATTYMPTEAWSHHAAVYDTSNLRHYAGGTERNTTANADELAAGAGDADEGAIGVYSNGSSVNAYFNGKIQEVQVHTASRSAAWVASEYAQTDDNSAFWGSWSWVAAGGGLSINVADTITLAEALTPDQPLGPISLADTISITEALALLQDIMPSVFDGISLSEFVALLKDVVPSVADSVSISESVVVSMIGNLIASVYDSITVEEAVSLLADVVPGVADSISLSEFVALLKDIVPSVADTISVAEFVDIAGIGVAGAISIADTIAIAEAVSILADVVPVVFDGISITEAITLAKDINPSLFDEISVNEYVAVSMMLAVGRVTATITGRTPGTTITGRRPGTTITAS